MLNRYNLSLEVKRKAERIEVKKGVYSYHHGVAVVPNVGDDGDGHKKYYCPLCREFGINLSIHYLEDNCPICGINLYWDKGCNQIDTID